MKKPKFILLWILCGALIFLGHRMYLVMTTYPHVTEIANRLQVAKHPDLDICVVHYPKAGGFPVELLSSVDCTLVTDRLENENSKHAVNRLRNMTFARDPHTPSICYGKIEYDVLVVNCDAVKSFVSPNEPPLPIEDSIIKTSLLYEKDKAMNECEVTVIDYYASGQFDVSRPIKIDCASVNHRFDHEIENYLFHVTHL